MPDSRTPSETDSFPLRHIGPDAADVTDMLRVVGAPTLQALVDQTLPANIRLGRALDLPPAVDEARLLEELEALGDVVYVELPKVGDTMTAGKPFGVVESTKAVSELFAPISGKITKVNSALTDEPATINTDPYGKGWIVEVEPSDPAQLDGLMDADGYNDLLAKTAT